MKLPERETTVHRSEVVEDRKTCQCCYKPTAQQAGSSYWCPDCAAIWYYEEPLPDPDQYDADRLGV